MSLWMSPSCPGPILQIVKYNNLLPVLLDQEGGWFFLHGIGGGACMPDIGSVGTCAARVSGKGNSFCHISLLKKTYSVNYHTTKVAGFGRREGQMSRPAPSIFLFNRSYGTMPTVHAVVVQANPGVPTRFCG